MSDTSKQAKASKNDAATTIPNGTAAASHDTEIQQVRKRLAPEDREHQIVQKAIAFFAEHGFQGSTRDLAKVLGVTQPLLYRYFPTKDALVDRVYEEVFLRRWNVEWEDWLADRSEPLAVRLKRYLKDYAGFVIRSEYVRVYIYSGLSHKGLARKYMKRLRERHFMLIAREMRHEYGIPDPIDAAEEEEELELIWVTHSSIFYFGVRKWIFELPVPKDIGHLIDMRVDAFLTGVPPVLKAARKNRKPTGDAQGD